MAAVQTKELLPDPRTASPDEVAARHDLLAQVRKAANNRPKPGREAFELYFVEGFESEEVAMVIGQPAAKARELISQIQERLRKEVLEQSLV